MCLLSFSSVFHFSLLSTLANCLVAAFLKKRITGSVFWYGSQAQSLYPAAVFQQPILPLTLTNFPALLPVPWSKLRAGDFPIFSATNIRVWWFNLHWNGACYVLKQMDSLWLVDVELVSQHMFFLLSFRLCYGILNPIGSEHATCDIGAELPERCKLDAVYIPGCFESGFAKLLVALRNQNRYGCLFFCDFLV